MKTFFLDDPREYSVKGKVIKDMGSIYLEPYEQLTFIKDEDHEFDFASFEWGFYVTPSVNFRAKKFGYKIALVVNEQNRMYVNAVLETKMEDFIVNIKSKGARIICWLDEWFQ